MARARAAVLQAAVLVLSVVRNSAAAAGANRELLQASPAGSPADSPAFGSSELSLYLAPRSSQDAYLTYQNVAPAQAVPNSYFTVDTSHPSAALGPASAAPALPDGDGDAADNLISAGIRDAAGALLAFTQTLTTLAQPATNITGLAAIMSPLGSQLYHIGDLIRLLVPLATQRADMDARFPNYGLIVEQWQSFINVFIEFPANSIDNLDINSISQLYNSNPRKLTEVQQFIYYFYHFTNPAVEALTTYLADPTNQTTQTAFLQTSYQLSTSTGTAYAPVSLYLNFVAVATNPSGICEGYPDSGIYAELEGVAGGQVSMCLFMLYAGLGAAELSYDRSKYQPYAAALASYALVTAVLADATNAIVNVIYDGGSDGAWNQQYVNNQGWYDTWTENTVAYYSNMAILFWNGQLNLDLVDAYQQAVIANGNITLSTQQIADGYASHFVKYPFMAFDFVCWTPSATSGTSLDGQQAAWGIPGGCQANAPPQPSGGNTNAYIVPATTATAAACTADGGSIFIPSLTLDNYGGTMPDAYMGLMIFFKPVGDAAPAPDPNQLNTVFSGCQTAAGNGDSAETMAACIVSDYGGRGSLVVHDTQNPSTPTSNTAVFTNLPAAGPDTSGSLFGVLPNGHGSGPTLSPRAAQELTPSPTNSPAQSETSQAPTPASDTPSAAPTPAIEHPPAALTPASEHPPAAPTPAIEHPPAAPTPASDPPPSGFWQ